MGAELDALNRIHTIARRAIECELGHCDHCDILRILRDVADASIRRAERAEIAGLFVDADGPERER